jgi:lycopene beta-cyclase
MQNKPVIILGDDLLGSLLAYRLNHVFPRMNFILCKRDDNSNRARSWTIQESELSSRSMDWLHPLISYKWTHHEIISRKVQRVIKEDYLVFTAEKLKDFIQKDIPIKRLSPEINMEELLDKSSFVINTLPDPLSNGTVFRKSVGLVVELDEDHRMEKPISMDSSVNNKELFRLMQFLPIKPNQLLIKDHRYSKHPQIDLETIEEDLLWEVRKKWKVKKTLKHESEVVLTGSNPPTKWNHHRLVKLGITPSSFLGDASAETVNLVDLLTQTSFRLGELKSVLNQYYEKQQEFKHWQLLSKVFYQNLDPGARHQFWDHVLRLPSPCLENFRNGHFSKWEMGKFLLGLPLLTLFRGYSSLPIMLNKSTTLEELT